MSKPKPELSLLSPQLPTLLTRSPQFLNSTQGSFSCVSAPFPWAPCPLGRGLGFHSSRLAGQYLRALLQARGGEFSGPEHASDLLDTTRILAPSFQKSPSFPSIPVSAWCHPAHLQRDTHVLGPRAGAGSGHRSLTPTLAPTDGSMPHSVHKHPLNTC